MSVVWESSGESFYADAELTPSAKVYLMVERLPQGNWSWAIWRYGDVWTVVQHGKTDTAQEGMWAAEKALK